MVKRFHIISKNYLNIGFRERNALPYAVICQLFNDKMYLISGLLHISLNSHECEFNVGRKDDIGITYNWGKKTSPA